MLPITMAAGVFVTLSGFALGWALSGQKDRWAVALLGSHSFLTCVAAGQWSILALAAVWCPAIAGLLVAKPNVGAIALSSWSQIRRAVPRILLVAASLLILSFAMRPGWVSEWRSTLGTAPWQHAPMFYPGGVVALLALAKWRRPEARLIIAYTLIPQTPGPYTDLLLFAVPRGRWEMVGLALLSYVALPLSLWHPRSSVIARVDQYGAVSTLVMLLPCVLMVLLRPNRVDSAHVRSAPNDAPAAAT